MSIKKDWSTIGKCGCTGTCSNAKSIEPDDINLNEAEVVKNTEGFISETRHKTELLETATIKNLEEQLSAAEKKADEYLNKLIRVQADMENMLRRSERDLSNAHKYAVEKFAFELLTVVDNLERSLVHKPTENNEMNQIYLGIELTFKLFLETLQKFGIVQINPLNQNFDPTYHTAMTTREDAAVKPGTVLEVMQKGYLLKDRLLRPAMVVVSK